MVKYTEINLVHLPVPLELLTKIEIRITTDNNKILNTLLLTIEVGKIIICNNNTEGRRIKEFPSFILNNLFEYEQTYCHYSRLNFFQDSKDSSSII